MPKQFEGKTCLLCQVRASSPTGEHVWPLWLLKAFPSGKRYTWWINGEQLLNRDGQPRKQEAVDKVKLPVCIACNSILSRRFEQPAKPLIRSVLDRDGNVVLSGPHAMDVAGWFLKTWLLLAHPAARESDPAVTPARWDSASDDLYGWMVTNQPPPTGLSIWVTRRAEEGPEPAVTQYIPLPTVIADGRTIQFSAKRAGVQFLDVSLVYHPDWEIEHPLELDGRALRLWPRAADAEAHFASLPPVHPKVMGWLKGPTLHFLPGALGSANLPPLSPSFDPMELLPQFTSGGRW
jgi:hypothetical protein